MVKTGLKFKNSSPTVAVRRLFPSNTLRPSAAASLLHAATYGLRASLACNQDGGWPVAVRRWPTPIEQAQRVSRGIPGA